MLDKTCGQDIDSSGAEGEFGRIKLLLVEDSKIDRAFVKKVLNTNEYRITEVVNGYEAVESFEREQPDIILMDINMPMMNGYDAVVRIKQLSEQRHLFVPIIFLTSIVDEDALIKCLQSGGDDFLCKPYNATLLVSKIESLMRIKKMHDQVQSRKNELEHIQQIYHYDMEIAEKIITNISRASNLNTNNIKFSISPVDILSGDLILSSLTPSKSQVFLLADFTGHGLGASIGCMIVADTFHAMVSKGYTMEEVIYELNYKLNITLPTGRFMAACMLEIRPNEKAVSVFNAGLPDVLICSNKNTIRFRSSSGNLPLGIEKNRNLDIKINHYQVMEDDRIYLYSDGLIDANNVNNDAFGSERLIDCIRKSTDQDAVFETILNTIEQFRSGVEQLDDISILEISCKDILIDDDEFRSGKDTREPGTWKFSISLNTDTLRELNPVPMIVQLLTDMQGIDSHRQNLYTIISELYLNSLEHGILDLPTKTDHSTIGFSDYDFQRKQALEQLKDGEIDIDIVHKPSGDGGTFSIRIRDTGNGFDVDQILSQEQSARGIGLVKSLSDSIDYRQSGREVEVNYSW